MVRLHETSVSLALAVATALSSGCGSDGAVEETPDDRPPPPTSIDEAIERRLERAGLDPVLATETELCRRLFADLIGRFPTAAEVDSTCRDRPVQDIASELQLREEYVVQGQRRWRDRIGSSDALLYWQDLVGAFDLVAQLQRQEIDYEQFAIAMSGQPALMALDPDPEGRAYRAHRVFLGNEATVAMANDLARLTRIWDTTLGEIPTFGLLRQESPRAYVVPGHCGELGVCKTELVPGGEIAFPDGGSRPFRPLKYEFTTDEQRAALTGLGRHIVSMPGFWYAAADEVLDRLLGWNDGGAVPRRPGRVLPEVRELLAEHLQRTKSIASAERMLVGSLLYTQTNRRVDDEAALDEMDPRPIWASGPLKFTPAEVVLDTIRGTSQAQASCDPRTADDDIYLRHLVGYFGAQVVGAEERDAEYEAFITEFYEEQGNWRPLVRREIVNPGDPEDTRLALVLDPFYFDTGRLFGGCPGANNPRLTALDGLGYAFGQEVAANRLCRRPEVEAWIAGRTDVRQATEALTTHLWSRGPTEEEVVTIEAMACEQCDPTERNEGLCVALLGGHEMLFY